MSRWVSIPEKKDSSEIVEDSLHQQIAALALTGESIRGMETKLKVPRAKIKKMLESPECKAIIKDAGDRALGVSLSYVRAEMLRLSKKAMGVLEKHLDKDNLQAVGMFLKTVDKEDRLPDEVADTAIQVILDLGNNKQDTINVTPKKD